MQADLQLTFRPLRSHDLAAISLVHQRACLIAYHFMNWSYPLSEIEPWYSSKFNEWTWTRGAFPPDGMAGFIAVRGSHIDQLFIDPTYQRCGIGTTLLVDALRSTSGRTTLNVFEANQTARTLYEKHGFRESDKWMNLDDDAMELLYVREARAATPRGSLT